MAHFIKGAANAWQNQLNWQARHQRQIDADDTSLFGINTIIPRIRNAWNHVMFIPAVVKGFVLGEELQDIPAVDIPESLRNTQWGQDMQNYQRNQQEINRLKVESLEDKIMGAITLNWNRFNEGRAKEEAIAHAEIKNEEVVLPGRTSERDSIARGDDRGIFNLQPPATPAENSPSLQNQR